MSRKSTIVRLITAAAKLLSTCAEPVAAQWLVRLFSTPLPRRTPPDETMWLGSARFQRLRFDAKRQLCTYAWGEGPPVVLAHGWASRGSHLSAFIRPLVDRGFRVVAFDQPAHGASDGRRSALPEFVRGLERVVEELGGVHGVVAHSLGAAATSVALSRGLAAGRVAYLAPPEDLEGFLVRAGAYLGFSKGSVQRARRVLERGFAMRFAAVRGRTVAPLIRTPLLVVHDSDDREVAIEQAERLVKAWGGEARLVRTSGLGHNRILNDPGAVRTVVDFVASEIATPVAQCAKAG